MVVCNRISMNMLGDFISLWFHNKCNPYFVSAYLFYVFYINIIYNYIYITIVALCNCFEAQPHCNELSA